MQTFYKLMFNIQKQRSIFEQSNDPKILFQLNLLLIYLCKQNNIIYEANREHANSKFLFWDKSRYIKFKKV
jgi:hypothetical protein